ncbi:MAG: DegV family protein [bacterium]|nr:DegV family protein [bacterium]
MAVRIVADSACDVPGGLLAALGVTVVPVHIIFGDRAYRDGVDITPRQVLERLDRGEYPRFSQPAPGDFVSVYRGAGGSSIVSIHVTAELSGTLNSAAVARELLPSLDISILDSRSGSMAAGWVVLEAARAAWAGLDRERVLASARSVVQAVALFLLVPDLTFLHRAGRLGRARAWLGKSLDLAPIITVREGQVVPFRLARGRRAGLRALVTGALTRFPAGRPLRAAAVHVAAEEDALAAVTALGKHFDLKETLITHAGGSVTGALGPGVVGLSLAPAGDAG